MEVLREEIVWVKPMTEYKHEDLVKFATHSRLHVVAHP